MTENNNSLNETRKDSEDYLKNLFRRSERLEKRSKKINEEANALSKRLNLLCELSESIIAADGTTIEKNNLR